MKRTFWTRNLFVGVLMGLVMVFGVQEICEALTLTQTSSPVQSKRMGSTFEMTFRVGLTGNKVQNHPDYSRRRINANDHTAPYQYIDSHGYEVDYIEETSSSYRTLTADPTAPTGAAFVVDPFPQYSTKSDGSAADPAAAGTPTTPYLVTSSGNLYDSAGKAVHIQTGDGTRTSDPVSPWRYKRATGYSSKPISEGADESARHDFNDEAIGITFPSAAGTVKLKNPSFTFGSIDKPTDLGASYTGAFSLKERYRVGLPTSITLVCEGATEGSHDIEIWDATNDNDFPIDGIPDARQPRQSITFTLHVTPATTTLSAGDTITPDIQRIPVEDAVEPVTAHLTFVGTNNRIRYEVVRGSGTLYVGTLEEQYGTPSTTLSVHQSSNVYLNTNETSNEIHISFAGEDRSAPRATIVFEYKGKDLPARNTGGTSGTGGTGGTGGTVTTRTPSLSISVSGTGTTRSVTVTAINAQGTAVPGLAVTLSGSALTTSQIVTSGTPATITIPSTPGTYTLQAVAGGYTVGTASITVTAPGSLALALIGGQVNGSQTVQVTARNSAGTLETTAVLVTLSGAGISRTVSVTGTQNVPLVLPTTSGTLFARAEGYNAGSVVLPARATGQQQQQQQQQQQTQQQQQQQQQTAGVADSIEIDGSRNLDATVNQALRLRVGVHDANDRGVSGVRVTFRVLAPGKGRLSQRGNGRAVQTETDRNGYATASLTPLGGNLIVEAKAAGVSAAVTFIITVDGSADDTGTGETTAPRTYNVRDEIPISLGDTLTFRGSRTLNGTTYTCVGSGECVVSYGTVVKGQIQVRTAPAASDTGDTPLMREIDPVVHVNAENRPPMLWVDGGKIYALVGKDVQEFISGVEGAMNIAIGGDKVYWTEKTGESAGTINAADLDGGNPKELKSITAVPMGIAVDTEGSKLYWTNSRGRIQSLNADGSGRVENVRQNLPSPMDIAISRGNLYWTQYDATAGTGSIGIANPTGRGTPKYISTGSDMPGSLVISGNKVYWTEKTGESSGTINSANLNGNGATQLASIRAVPSGIAVDTARSKLYWTNSRGRVQNADLTGKKIVNVVDGLGMPGDMVISNSIKAPTAAKTTTPKSTTPAANKYDINSDGTVDIKDSEMLTLLIAAGETNAKYDVNGDGEVNINDVTAIIKKRAAGAASAPTLLGRKFSALEIDRLQEQIEILIASGDRSPAAMKTLIYLQQLIAMARPEKTQLLANYPNPFNPETWMPYELATDTDVRLTIYNAQGVVIRVLHLGQQSAGYYTDRERAAYWDGRNALGEQVASGIYFYQLETDEISSLRKMVILK